MGDEADSQARTEKMAPTDYNLSDLRERGAIVCVVGLGRSGLAAAEFLLRRGLKVRGLELAMTAEMQDAWAPLAALGAELITGPHPTDALAGGGLLVRSPGVPAEVPILEAARAQGMPIRSELGLAASEVRTPLVAITGTNGKSTTTAWTAHLLRSAGIPAVAAGNIGRPLTAALLEEGKDTVFVAEVSSFQLEDSPELHPRAAAILNITPDHLDRHGSLAAYRALKWAITANQGTGDRLVLGPDVVPSGGQVVRAEVVQCASERTAESTDALFPHEGWLCHRSEQREERLLSLDALALPGPHNLLNGMAAAALAASLVPDYAALLGGLQDFPGLPHRLEEVGRLGAVRLINDSKATNIDALRVALQSFAPPLVLIAGGRDKGAPFEELRDLATARVRHLVALGEAAETIRAAWPELPSETAADMDDAVKRALAAAAGKGTVLLSPGCASFDMYRNYEERGDDFRNVVAGVSRAAASSVSGKE